MSNPTETGTPAVAESAEAGKRDLKTVLRQSLQQGLAFGTLIVLFIFFSIANPAFLQWSNISGVLLATAVIGILAVGTTLVIITGGIDLSIGTGMTFAAVITGVTITNFGLPMWVGILAGMATGALMGAVNGANIVFLKVPPFIATLAMMMITQGLNMVVSGVKPVYIQVDGFKTIALGELIPGFPNAVLILFACAIVASILLTRTILGRYTFSIGSNEEATRLSGINTSKWKIIIYMTAGIFTGIAGVVLASRLGSAQPQLGMGYELQAIAAVVIGGTSMLGGRGSILGTLIGALVMSVLINGLRIMSIQTEWQNVVVGIVILLAVWSDSLRTRKGA
ncbi:ABC transporter permease [Micropruina sp.]|uniref:ABC transporter permease n=1 Tax=Micropruina sp. TaxID=2737536 RepID=UPI0026034972|nr:ABC transporter permease [Micropruina sp.]